MHAAADARVDDITNLARCPIDEVLPRRHALRLHVDADDLIAVVVDRICPADTEVRHRLRMNDDMVMPEIGLAELPIWPQMREETVVKKKPKIMISTPPSRFTPICGRNASTIARPMEPNTVMLMGRSSSVRSFAATAWPRRL